MSTPKIPVAATPAAVTPPAGSSSTAPASLRPRLFSPKADAPPPVEYLIIPNEYDLEMPQWSMATNKVEPGEPIKVVVTIRNLGTKPIKENFILRVSKDEFFQSVSVQVSEAIAPTKDIQVAMTLLINGGRNNLDKLPSSKEILLLKDVNGKLAKIASIPIQVPIDVFVRYLKEEFADIRLLCWGLFGTGKSSFINSVATLFNEDPKFVNKKLTPAFSRPAGKTVTTELHTYKFNNVTVMDTWGWEAGRKELYSELLFQMMLGGMLGDEYKMQNASDLTVFNAPKVSGAEKKVDVALFFITYSAVADTVYLDKMNDFIEQCRKLHIPSLILLTQIDKVDPSMRDDPYVTNQDIDDLLGKVCGKIQFDDSYVCPVVNYTRERERVWAMDRAAFVTLYRAFQARVEQQQ